MSQVFLLGHAVGHSHHDVHQQALGELADFFDLGVHQELVDLHQLAQKIRLELLSFYVVSGIQDHQQVVLIDVGYQIADADNSQPVVCQAVVAWCGHQIDGGFAGDGCVAWYGEEEKVLSHASRNLILVPV